MLPLTSSNMATWIFGPSDLAGGASFVGDCCGKKKVIEVIEAATDIRARLDLVNILILLVLELRLAGAADCTKKQPGHGTILIFFNRTAAPAPGNTIV